MKAIVQGRRFNTDTARHVATIENEGLKRNPDDALYYKEELYVTTKGQWFLASSGKANKPFLGANLIQARSGITLISSDQARDWLEQAEEWDVLEQEFVIFDG